ncbi:serine hydrolase [Microtetraspora fusca]|uniref:serine hydrolase n=1 Tax=Microtetraspora fusca TaxID=1997 RepID=UPI00082BBEAF|nr:serine hydrolase [Microtetraspora fusca]
MHIRPRPARALIPLVAATLALAACGTAPERQRTAPSSTATASPAAQAAIPATPVGDQLRWFLAAAAKPPIPEDQLTAHLSAGFLSQVPPDKLNELFGRLSELRLDRLTEVKPTSLVGRVMVDGEPLTLSIAVDSAGKIDKLLLSAADQPSAAPMPASWDEIDTRLRAVAPDVGFLAAEITADGSCRPVHAISPAVARPTGSLFKLYVLGAVAERIRAGKLSWDTPLTITDRVRIPPGVLYEKPAGSVVPLREAAKLMISISDNAATDLLMEKVGRAAVEAQVRKWSTHASLNIPFLTTREFVLLKAADYPRLADTYAGLKGEQRRRFLETTVAQASLEGLKEWTEPRHVTSVEWFGSPSDVCRAYAGLAKLDSEPLNKVMSANDAGLGLDRERWPTVWYKGGSEVGLLTMGFLARSAEGRTYVVTALTSNPRAAYDEARAANELLALIRGSFTLLTG